MSVKAAQILLLVRPNYPNSPSRSASSSCRIAGCCRTLCTYSSADHACRCPSRRNLCILSLQPTMHADARAAAIFALTGDMITVAGYNASLHPEGLRWTQPRHSIPLPSRRYWWAASMGNLWEWVGGHRMIEITCFLPPHVRYCLAAAARSST